MLESLCPRCGAYWSCRCKRSDAAMRIRVSLRATAADAGVDAGALARKIAADMGRSVDQVFPLDTLRDEEEQP